MADFSRYFAEFHLNKSLTVKISDQIRFLANSGEFDIEVEPA